MVRLFVQHLLALIGCHWPDREPERAGATRLRRGAGRAVALAPPRDHGALPIAWPMQIVWTGVYVANRVADGEGVGFKPDRIGRCTNSSPVS